MEISIDSDKLQENIKDYTDINSDMKDMLEEIRSKTEYLKGYWDSKTSAQVFEEFKTFDEKFSNKIEKNENYILFLDDVVKKNYVNLEEKINKEVNEKIAVK